MKEITFASALLVKKVAEILKKVEAILECDKGHKN
jgi:hypothetical protein